LQLAFPGWQMPVFLMKGQTRADYNIRAFLAKVDTGLVKKEMLQKRDRARF
jgi:hypothetical protein